MSIVPTSAQPDMKQVGLGALLELIGVLIVILPGLLADGELRLEMPWLAIGGVFVLVGSAISLKALFDARRVDV